MVVTTAFQDGATGSGSYFADDLSWLALPNDLIDDHGELLLSRDVIFGSGVLQSALRATKQIVVELPLLSTHERVLRIVSFLGVSKSQLARLFGISRPTLYAWIDGTAVPQPDNLERIRFLSDVVSRTQWDMKRPLFHEYVELQLPGETQSLFEQLSASDVNLEKVSALADKAWNFTLNRERRISETNAGVPRDDVLTDNLTALGAEG